MFLFLKRKCKKKIKNGEKTKMAWKNENGAEKMKMANFPMEMPELNYKKWANQG